jgi:hypothetical protein
MKKGVILGDSLAGAEIYEILHPLHNAHSSQQ